MKLARFSIGEGTPHFGFVRGEGATSFERAMQSAGVDFPELASMGSYLENLPRSFELARQVEEASVDLEADAMIRDVRFHAPLDSVPAMLDFGLSPRHLKNSALTLIRYEYGALARAALWPLLALAERRLRRSTAMPYYKCNHNAVIADGDEMHWPRYSSYLDIEPELAIVTGTDVSPIAGYTILNDASARDVQMPEMFGGGPARCKDFDRSNGLGPFLVTPDEVGDPLSIDVRVRIGRRIDWRGSTDEYKNHPDEVIAYLRTILTPLPGTVLGMGTIPDCTGLDNDEWLEPGDAIEIGFTGLGTLHQRVPSAPADLEKSRWRARPELTTRP